MSKGYRGKAKIPYHWGDISSLLMEVRSVDAPHTMSCWFRATQIMPMFVVGERYLAGKNSNQDFKFAIYKLEQNLGIPVNNKQRSFLCHQSCSAASTLCCKADHTSIALLLSIEVALPMVDFPDCAPVPCAMEMNSMRIQRSWPVSNFR